jgi:hypothetical protein
LTALSRACCFSSSTPISSPSPVAPTCVCSLYQIQFGAIWGLNEWISTHSLPPTRSKNAPSSSATSRRGSTTRQSRR